MDLSDPQGFHSICLQRENGLTFPLTTPTAKLDDALGIGAPTSKKWQSVVYFNSNPYECDELISADPIEVHIYDVNRIVCGGPQSKPCTICDEQIPIYDYSQLPPILLHYHCVQMRVQVDKDMMLEDDYVIDGRDGWYDMHNASDFIINHEFGHVLGLSHPASSDIHQQGLDGCYYLDEPVVSIMHDFVTCDNGQSYHEHNPSRYDIGMVAQIALSDQ